MQKIGEWMIIGGIIFAFLPLAIAFLAEVPEYLLGCTVHEGFSNSCYVFGVDIGDTLYSMFAFGWMSLLSFPIGFGTAALGLLVSVLGRIFKKKTTHETPSNNV